MTTRPSVVGRCTSTICTAQNFSSTVREVSPPATRPQPLPQTDVQRVGQERHQDVRLDAVHLLVMDGAHAQIAFQVLERFLHLHQLHVEGPQLGGRPAGQVAA